MPINRDQFDNGLDDTENRILNFLKEKPNNAYNTGEIAEVIKPKSDTENIALIIIQTMAVSMLVERILKELTKKQLIEKKIINGTAWYSIKRR